MENFSKIESNESNFIFPNIQKEAGEIIRVAQIYSPENPELFAREFYEKAKKSALVDLTEKMWGVLENTDSFDIYLNDWEKIEEHINYTNKETGASRDWKDLRNKIEKGGNLDAPIILKHLEKMHLVSGNTRLMVARALGKKPKVLLVEL